MKTLWKYTTIIEIQDKNRKISRQNSVKRTNPHLTLKLWQES
jgi:hypothetical protein